MQATHRLSHAPRCTYALLLVLLSVQGFVTFVSGKEHGFALLAQNSIKDFAFEFQQNNGRLELQDKIPIRSTILQHVQANITKDVILDLASQGYDMFMFAQVNMIAPALEVARARPDLYFGFIAYYPSAQNVSNFKCFQMSSGQGFYMMGYLAGKMTKTNKVGYVGLASGIGLSPPAVSFGFGLQDANPKAEMHIWDQNTTVEPLATKVGERATRDLLARGCDMFVADAVRKDDNLLRDAQLKFANTGWFGTPVDLREWIGDSAMTSVVFDWSTHIRTFMDLVVNDTWSSAPFLMVGNLANNKTPLKPLSPRVPADVAQDFYARLKVFSNNTLAPFCGRRVEAVLADGVKPALPGGCIDATQFLTSIVKYPDFAKYYGVMTLPSDQILLDDGLQAGLYVVSGLAALVSLLMIVAIVIVRERAVIYYAGWAFCVLMCVGSIIVDVGAALLLPERSAATCNVQIWLTTIGGSLLIGVLLARQFRLAAIQWASQDLKHTPVKNLHVGLVAAVYVFINIIVLILFSAIETPDVIVHQYGDDPDLGEYEWRYVCELEDVATGCLITLIVINGCVLLVACVMAIYARGMRIKLFDESNWMSLGVFSSAFAGGVGLLAWFTATGYVAKTLVAYAGIMITGNIALLWIMIPKFYCVITRATGSEHHTETDLRPTGESKHTGKSSGTRSGANESSS